MSWSTREWTPQASEPVLSAALLARIHELNCDYLELLAAEQSLGCTLQLGLLPPRFAPSLLELEAEARQALAATSYTLYSLGFENELLWSLLLDAVAAPRDLGASDCELGERMHHRFTELALLLAWHIANCSILAARMAYAMSIETARRFAELPLTAVRRIAAEQPNLLTPRWPTNPSFWPDLVRFAGSKDAARLRTSQLLGHQLIAAELECAEAPRTLCVRSPPPIVRSPRLRASKLRAPRALARL